MLTLVLCSAGVESTRIESGYQPGAQRKTQRCRIDHCSASAVTRALSSDSVNGPSTTSMLPSAATNANAPQACPASNDPRMFDPQGSWQ